MEPDTILYVTDRGSILMPNGSLALPGGTVVARDFAKHQENLKTLLASGNLSLQPVKATGLDVRRVDELAPALPNEINLKTGEGVPRTVAGSQANDAETLRRVAEIKAAKEQREKALAEVGEGAVVTLEEAQALGLVRGQ